MLTALTLLAITITTVGGLVRMPVLTLTVIALTGAGVANGVISAPEAIAAPIGSLRADVTGWQADQAAGLTCNRLAVRALTSENELQLAAADRACENVR